MSQKGNGMRLYPNREVYLDTVALDELKKDAKNRRLILTASCYDYSGEACKMWTNKGIAHYLGITEGHFYALMAHKNILRDGLIVKISTAFGCTTSFVIGDSKDKTLLDKYQTKITENNKFLMRSLDMLEHAGLSVSPHSEDFIDEEYGTTLYYPDIDFVINGVHLTEEQFKALARGAQNLVRTHIEGALALCGAREEENHGNDQEKR